MIRKKERLECKQRARKVTGKGNVRNTEPAGPGGGHLFPYHRQEGSTVAQARDWGESARSSAFEGAHLRCPGST